jgi:hypothetical protein
MNLNPVSLVEILRSVRPVAYSSNDLEALKVYLLGAQKNALDLYIVGGLQSALEMMKEGILMLQSHDLGVQLAFISVDAGRGFFGGQKTRVATYTADLYRNEYVPGPVLSGLLRSLVGINNMYREAGLLRGSGI